MIKQKEEEDIQKADMLCWPKMADGNLRVQERKSQQKGIRRVVGDRMGKHEQNFCVRQTQTLDK